MTNDEILISSLIFVSILLFSLAMHLSIRFLREKRELIERIKRIGEGTQSPEKKSVFHEFKDHWTRFVEALGNRIKPKKDGRLSHLRRTLLKAGFRRENATVILFGMKAFLGILFFAIFLTLKPWLFKTMPSLRFLQFSIVLALIGFYLPDLWIRLRIASRREKIREGLPDALDLMVVCVESGNGLDAAINRVGDEMKMSNRILSEEFKLLNLETRAGKQRQDALRNLAERTDLEEISSLVTLLIQTERFGTSIGQALRVHSDSMRTKRYQRAEEIANKMPVKLIFPLIFFIFPAILVVVLGPAIISIFRTLLPLGRV